MEPADPLRFKLVLHYDGAAFHGWQLQPDRRTVQGDLEAALSKLADRPVRVHAAGRTDTGVHATGQVASADMPPSWTAERLERSLNAVLPREVWVESVTPAVPDFHPRFDAIARSYAYRVGTARGASSPFERGRCWPLAEELDRSLLDEAVSLLQGEHSFKAFAKAGQPERGETCTVQSAAWSSWSLGVTLEITADRFLHHMVRYLVGTSVDVARGRRPIADVARLLANEAGVTTSPPAPPEGLTLVRVTYPDNAVAPPPPSASRSTAPA